MCDDVDGYCSHRRRVLALARRVRRRRCGVAASREPAGSTAIIARVVDRAMLAVVLYLRSANFSRTPRFRGCPRVRAQAHWPFYLLCRCLRCRRLYRKALHRACLGLVHTASVASAWLCGRPTAHRAHQASRQRCVLLAGCAMAASPGCDMTAGLACSQTISPMHRALQRLECAMGVRRDATVSGPAARGRFARASSLSAAPASSQHSPHAAHSGVLALGMRLAFDWGVRVGVVAPTAAAQRAALVDLYVSTNGSTWSTKTGWQNYSTGSDPCDNAWPGVSCSGSGGTASRDV
jgi:hypothetical protein